MAIPYSVREARKLLGDERLINFLRFVNANHGSGGFIKPLAVELINQKLDKNQSLHEIFSSESGYILRVLKLDESRYIIEFGCFPGPCVGDSGTWRVRFNTDNTVHSAEMVAFSIS